MSPLDAAAAGRLHAFLLEAGRALTLAGTAVSEVQERLTRIAEHNGAPGARVVVLPTTLIVSLGAEERATIEAIPQLTGALRLDQISALYVILEKAERGDADLVQGLLDLHRIRTMKPRYNRLVTVIGYMVMTVGLCLILQPTPLDVAVAAIFGVLVGVIVVFSHGRHTLSVLAPIICAILVSALTFEAVKRGIADPSLRTLIAPLVTFLPGGVLTTATVELASGEMVAGASRMVFGSLQMVLLAFGIVAGVEIVGLPRPDLVGDAQANMLGWWAPWLGVILFGVAVSVFRSAPRGALPWLLLVLLVAWVGQLIGEELVGSEASGFVGALVMTPVALAVAALPNGPPSQVTFLPAFWLLVPGAIGLISVTEMVSNPASASVGDLVQPIAGILGIALGVLCGVSIYRGVTTAPRRLLRNRG
ncbi:threonine/serine exporter family protein [Actinophytocola sp.]|uniref:threonine/serine ThrE exporter family protein n=1 Tax=Actinophytocola sp. TaxID=1872138 RepID=UPI002D807304|nr:threonine/serine exporter family protein [Actinophytocola sp.]HET9139594.1 threonine/serine exporter family protein [Actinophytocola sp.]